MHFKYIGPDEEVFTEVFVNRLTKKVKVINYTDDFLDRAFGVKEDVTYQDVMEFFESRTFPRRRGDINEILKVIGLKEYNAYKMCKILGGKKAEDGCRVEFL